MSSLENVNGRLSPAQAGFIYWLNGLAPVATNIVTPLITYWFLRGKPDKTLLQKYNLQVNEVGRQLVSGTIGLLSYFGGGELTRGGINLGFDRDQKMDAATKQIAMTVGGVATSFLGFAILRPMLSADLICKFLKREGGEVLSFSEKELRSHLAKMATSPGKFSVDGAMDGIIRQKRADIAIGGKNNHWLFGPIQSWVDKNLVPDGVPKLGKTAAYATGVLTAYLGSLTLMLWGINRLLGPAARPAQPPLEVPHTWQGWQAPKLYVLDYMAGAQGFSRPMGPYFARNFSYGANNPMMPLPWR